MLGSAGGTFAQDYKQNIERNFLAYMQAMAEKDVSTAIEYLHDSFFEVVDKATLLELMEQSLNNPDVESNIGEVQVLEIENKTEIEGNYYSKLGFSTQVFMRFINNKASANSPIQQKVLRGTFNRMYGEENVDYNPDTFVWTLLQKKQAVAISDNGITGWKFIVLEKGQEALMSQMLPKQILEDLR